MAKSVGIQKKREIARKDEKIAHAQGTTYKWTSEEAQAVEHRGGSISKRRPMMTSSGLNHSEGSK